MLRGGTEPLDIYRHIDAGINGTPMPSFHETLKENRKRSGTWSPTCSAWPTAAARVPCPTPGSSRTACSSPCPASSRAPRHRHRHAAPASTTRQPPLRKPPRTWWLATLEPMISRLTRVHRLTTITKGIDGHGPPGKTPGTGSAQGPGRAARGRDRHRAQPGQAGGPPATTRPTTPRPAFFWEASAPWRACCSTWSVRLVAGKTPLELIRVYLTFPLGEKALQLTDTGQSVYAVERRRDPGLRLLPLPGDRACSWEFPSTWPWPGSPPRAA